MDATFAKKSISAVRNRTNPLNPFPIMQTLKAPEPLNQLLKQPIINSLLRLLGSTHSYRLRSFTVITVIIFIFIIAAIFISFVVFTFFTLFMFGVFFLFPLFLIRFEVDCGVVYFKRSYFLGRGLFFLLFTFSKLWS